MSAPKCTLRRCKGKRGCLCTKKVVTPTAQAPFTYSSLKKPPNIKTIVKSPTQPTSTRGNGRAALTKNPKLPVELGDSKYADAMEQRGWSTFGPGSYGPQPSSTDGPIQPNQSNNNTKSSTKNSKKPADPSPGGLTPKSKPIPKDGPAFETTPPVGSKEVQKKEEVAAVTSGIVVLRYNHYRHEFTINSDDGMIDVAEIKDTFCFDYGFKGNYKVWLRSKTRELIKSDEGFAEIQTQLFGLKIGGEYYCEMEEDPEIVKQRESEPQKTFTANRSHPNGQPTVASSNITSQLKQMSAAELRENGADYRALLEARDIEDVLYGGGNMLLGDSDEEESMTITAPISRATDSPDSLDRDDAFDNDDDTD